VNDVSLLLQLFSNSFHFVYFALFLLCVNCTQSWTLLELTQVSSIFIVTLPGRLQLSFQVESCLFLIGSTNLAAYQPFGQLTWLRFQHGYFLAQHTVLRSQSLTGINEKSHMRQFPVGHHESNPQIYMKYPDFFLILLLFRFESCVFLFPLFHALGAIFDVVGGYEKRIWARIETGRHFLLKILQKNKTKTNRFKMILIPFNILLW